MWPQEWAKVSKIGHKIHENINLMFCRQSVYVSNKNSDSGDKFWQLASAGYIEDGCLLSSSKIVQELDFRVSFPILQVA